MTIEDLKNHCEKQIDLCSKLNDYKHLEEHQLILNLIKENQQLKKQLEVGEEQYNDLIEEKEELQEQLSSNTLQLEELKKQLEQYKGSHYCSFINICKSTKIANYIQQKEFISYLNNEKDRLSRECSQIYEDSLGKTRLVNEDIFNAINDVLQKYKEIIGGNKDEK